MCSARTHIVDLGDIFQWIDLVDFGLELTRAEQIEKLVGVKLELLTSLDIAKESRASNLDALWRKFSALKPHQYYWVKDERSLRDETILTAEEWEERDH